MTALVLSAFLTAPAPLEMPRATAYLIRSDDRIRLEDRFNQLDLWISQTVDGRWFDDDGRIFTHATLSVVPPPDGATNSAATRLEYEQAKTPLAHKDLEALRSAMELLSPVGLAEKGVPPRQSIRGYRDIDYYEGTNRSAIVCAYLPETERNADGRPDRHLPRIWRLAVWELADDDDFDEAKECFEKEFLEADDVDFLRRSPTRMNPESAVSERELLRRDARHSVAAYADWHVTDSDEFTVLDDLPGNREFIASLTNDLRRMRAEYTKTLPTPVDGSNVLAVARIYASRDEYLDALEADGITNMNWTAAYWSPNRRELVAYLPTSGVESLRNTIRHEAFHQYLSYATSMIPVSPWLNEGYAGYFEGETVPEWSAEDLERLEKLLPPLMMMDYGEFYSGTDSERRLKYDLALTLAVFLEQGAPKVRFDPFKGMKADYIENLFRTHDMQQATTAALKNPDQLKLFQREWTKFMLSGRAEPGNFDRQ